MAEEPDQVQAHAAPGSLQHRRDAVEPRAHPAVSLGRPPHGQHPRRRLWLHDLGAVRRPGRPAANRAAGRDRARAGPHRLARAAAEPALQPRRRRHAGLPPAVRQPAAGGERRRGRRGGPALPLAWPVGGAARLYRTGAARRRAGRRDLRAAPRVGCRRAAARDRPRRAPAPALSRQARHRCRAQRAPDPRDGRPAAPRPRRHHAAVPAAAERARAQPQQVRRAQARRRARAGLDRLDQLHRRRLLPPDQRRDRAARPGDRARLRRLLRPAGRGPRADAGHAGDRRLGSAPRAAGHPAAVLLAGRRRRAAARQRRHDPRGAAGRPAQLPVRPGAGWRDPQGAAPARPARRRLRPDEHQPARQPDGARPEARTTRRSSWCRTGSSG